MGRRAALRGPALLTAFVAIAALVGSNLDGTASSRRACAAPPAEPALRSASEVVIRGKKTLEDAIRAAMPTPVAGEPPPLVAFVVDVTPNVVKRAEVLRSAIARLDRDETFAREIRLAPLGRGVGAAAKALDELNRDVATLLKKETPAVDTMVDLRKSLATIREPAVVVYLCDWRFEDDFQVDALAADLAERKIVFSVVGTEAAFGHAWTDGSVDPTDRISGRVVSGDYYPGIGRSPFGKPVAEAPWHGGDSAYPAIPYRFHGMLWETEFQKPSKSSPLKDALGGLLGGGGPGGPGGPGMAGLPPAPPDVPGMDDPDPAEDPDPPEDLGERLGLGGKGLDPDAIRRYPIPSGFGPYGLMRLAAVTGGRYALFSWNPGGRARVTYDYGRCNLFGPDLRSRERLLSEFGSDPIASATILAWHALVAGGGLVDHTPPLDKDLKSPRSIDEIHSGSEFNFTWDTYSDWKALRRAITRATPAVTEARQLLELALDGAKDPEGDVARRRLADARLLEFTVRVLEFELHELDLATKDVKPELWRKIAKGKIPGAAPNEFILGSGSPLAELGIGFARGDDAKALDAAAGERIAKARKEHIERYKGTPFGAQVDLADVKTFRIVEWEKGSPIGRGGIPSESGGGKHGPTTPPPGGGSGGGGGPTTGK